MSIAPIRIGLMGCGTVADYGHIPGIQSTGALELYSIYEPNEERLKYIQEKFGIQNAFTSMEPFFGSSIHAVSVTSPAPCHKDNVLAAAKHRMPVLCEKPLAMNPAEAQAMISTMKESGVSLHNGFCYRFSPCALKIRELVHGKAIGEVRSLRLLYNWNCHGKYTIDENGEKTIQKRREGRMLEGGPMVDCGTHQIDLAMFWLGSEVVRFSGHGAWVDEYEAPDHMWLHMDHANGAHTVVEISYSYHHTTKNSRSEFVYELIGTDGVIRYDDTAKRFAMEDETGTHEFEFHDVKDFRGMYTEWARALLCGKSELLATAHDGMRVVEIARQATNEVINNRRTSRMEATA